MRRTPFILIFALIVALAAFAKHPQSEYPAIAELIARADSGDVKAQYDLSGLLDIGFADVAIDSVEATRYLKLASEAGYAPAQNMLGYRYYMGQGGLERNEDEGIRLIGKAAAQGDIKAANNLGWLLQRQASDTTEADAIKWYTKAANAGLPSAMAQLADLYKEGRGVPQDSIKAVELYTEAIEAGLFDAQLKLLAMMHDNYTRLSPGEALELGRKYYMHNGQVVGVTLFEIAAEKGSPEALALLGDAYSRAQGVNYDHNRSLYYFYKAALEGNPSAQFVVAELLDMFPDALEDLPADEQLLIIDDPQYWYEKAAEAGITDAEKATKQLLNLL